nr:MAG TPA: hypothetical protein [Bacteriophage sp.]
MKTIILTSSNYNLPLLKFPSFRLLASFSSKPPLKIFIRALLANALDKLSYCHTRFVLTPPNLEQRPINLDLRIIWSKGADRETRTLYNHQSAELFAL